MTYRCFCGLPRIEGPDGWECPASWTHDVRIDEASEPGADEDGEGLRWLRKVDPVALDPLATRLENEAYEDAFPLPEAR